MRRLIRAGTENDFVTEAEIGRTVVAFREKGDLLTMVINRWIGVEFNLVDVIFDA